MKQDKGDQRLEESEKDMTRASLHDPDAKKPDGDLGDDQSVVPTLTKDLLRMIEVGGRLGLHNT